MANISIGDAIGAGFGLIRARPVSVLAWGLARVALSVGMLSSMAPFYVQVLRDAATRTAGGVATPPDFSSMMAMQGLSWLFSLLGVMVGAILYCAVWRGVLHPEQKAYAYLRIGAPEVFVFLLNFGLGIAVFIGVLILAIPIAIVAGVAFATHAAAVGVLVAILGGLAVLCLMVWLFCRLALVGPMMVDDGKFHLTDAWALTKGHAGTILAIALLLFVVLMILVSVIGLIAVAVGVGFVGQAAGGLTNIQAFFQQPANQILAALGPALIVYGLAAIPVSGGLLAIMFAPWAKVYRDLAPPDVAATFA
ncbi:MAG: hypothetical protein ACREEB_08305 [Caulobacteraceae bacterium]